jgi:hypothetical protein
LLVDGAPDPREVGCSFGLHTILFVLGGVVVDFGASSFGFQTGLLFLSGAGMAFGVFSSLVICLIFFCFDFPLRLDINLP